MDMYHKLIRSRLFLIVLVVVIFLGGFFVGLIVRLPFGKGNSLSTGASVRQIEPQYKFVSPLLAVGDSPSLRGHAELERQLKSIIDKARDEKRLISASVYFRGLGQWTGVNENELYSPASMLKVTYLIAYLRLAERNPDILEQEVVYKIDSEKRQLPAEPGEPTLEPGKSYTVTELLQRLIIYSDNEAAAILDTMLSKQAKEMVFTDLGLPVPDFDDAGDMISPKSFSLFFRVLFNASYLSRNASETALNLLSQTNFTKGIVAGVPEGTTVSHKYGHRVQTEGESTIEELHDCGIVYYHQNPYTLCIMTKGTNLDALADVIKDISHQVYQYVDSQ